MRSPSSWRERDQLIAPAVPPIKVQRQHPRPVRLVPSRYGPARSRTCGHLHHSNIGGTSGVLVDRSASRGRDRQTPWDHAPTTSGLDGNEMTSDGHGRSASLPPQRPCKYIRSSRSCCGGSSGAGGLRPAPQACLVDSGEPLIRAATFQLQWKRIGTAPSRLNLTGQFSAAFCRILLDWASM